MKQKSQLAGHGLEPEIDTIAILKQQRAARMAKEALDAVNEAAATAAAAALEESHNQPDEPEDSPPTTSRMGGTKRKADTEPDGDAGDVRRLRRSARTVASSREDSEQMAEELGTLPRILNGDTLIPVFEDDQIDEEDAGTPPREVSLAARALMRVDTHDSSSSDDSSDSSFTGSSSGSSSCDGSGCESEDMGLGPEDEYEYGDEDEGEHADADENEDEDEGDLCE